MKNVNNIFADFILITKHSTLKIIHDFMLYKDYFYFFVTFT